MKTLVVIFLICLSAYSFSQERTELKIPDILGFITLKGDFHIHTPFSDGSVWPDDRVYEAWIEGLDVIAITDHIEYHAYSEDVIQDRNRPYEIAKPAADKYNMILIKAGEITRSMPPGHFNAFFLTDVNALDKEDWMDSFQAAADQGAYIIWNHPGWKAQQPDTTKWFDIHTELYDKGWLKGIEVVNYNEYYPEVFQWAIDKNLTMFGNSDIHGPISFEYDYTRGNRRPVTLVFVKERSEYGVREAFENGRTAIFYENKLLGKKDYLEGIFKSSIKITPMIVEFNESNQAYIQIKNTSDIPFHLERIEESNEFFDYPNSIEIPANTTVLAKIESKTPATILSCLMKYKVMNLFTGPKENLNINLSVTTNNLNYPEILIKDGAYFINSFITDIIKMDGLSCRYSVSEQPLSEVNTKTETGIDNPGFYELKFSLFEYERPFGRIYRKSICLHLGIGSTIELANEPNSKYSSIGIKALSDGLLGSKNYKDGHWLGFEGDDAEIVIETKGIVMDSVAINFLHTTHSWIFMPESVELLISDNGKEYESLDKMSFPAATDEDPKEINTVMFHTDQLKAKYIKIIAKNVGTCPDWHSGKGKPAWLFVDEVILF